MKGAVVEGKEREVECDAKCLIDAFNGVGCGDAACDGALIGDDDEREARGDEGMAGVVNAGEQFDERGIYQVAW
jgi:hypothetical protein